MAVERVSGKDREVLRRLGADIAAAADDPVNAQRRALHERIDHKQQGRPAILIYQQPWCELAQDGSLTLQCESAFAREMENDMRRRLFQWRHHPGDMVLTAESVQPFCIHDTGFGLEESTTLAISDPDNDVVSRHFHIQIREESDIAKIKDPIVSHDRALTDARLEQRQEIFAGLLAVRKEGCRGFWFAPWDELVRWTGIEEILLDMALRPEYVHNVIARLIDAWHTRLDQYEEQGLLAAPAHTLDVHGAAQIFSEVSPAMHAEFALRYEAGFCRRFGRVYYGCCEPLHHKVDICAEYLPNLYKISMSPWIDFRQAVRAVRDRFIFAWKPNPALLAMNTWNPELVRTDIREKLALARAEGCIVEIHLKDISTVRYQPWRLTEWDAIAKEEADRAAA